MKTKTELEKDILDITMKIHQEFPELYKFISEMPIQNIKIDNEGMGTKSLKQYYNSLEEILIEYAKTHPPLEVKSETKIANSMEMLNYPSSEDIYNKGDLATEINPDNPSTNKSLNETKGKMYEKGLQGNRFGNDLDVPGSELDDQEESVGSEDEENNYYSVGGDDHNDLEEDKS